VELASLHEPTLVPRAVAAAVGVLEEPRRPLLETLSRLLGPRALLLVVDNCEHLAAACAGLADSLLRACPRVRILATSREALGIAGEVTWRVPSLSTPDPQRVPLPEELHQYEATRLFVDRAAAARPGFGLTVQNGPAVAEICYRLDGIPLAIELAAARVKALAVEQIASRLDRRFRLLTSGSRAALPRHRTLRALVDWSHELLSQSERVLLRRLSVFAGGWSLEAAEAVCAVGAGLGTESRVPRTERGSSPTPLAEGEEQDTRDLAMDDILELLASLVDKSLVLADEQGGEERYRLLETLREYALERLDAAGETEYFRHRHAVFFLALAERAEPHLEGPEQVAWLDRLEQEHDNVRVALRWSERNEDPEVLLRLAGALWDFWWMRGHVTEGLSWLVRALSRSEQRPPDAARAKALQGAGLLASISGEHERAAQFFDQSVALWRTLPDAPGLARALGNGGFLAWLMGDGVRGVAMIGESLARSREREDSDGIGYALFGLGCIALFRGDLEASAPLLDESLTAFRRAANPRGIANAGLKLAEVALGRGDRHGAETLGRQSLALLRKLRDSWGLLMSLLHLGLAAVMQGDHTRAARLFGATDALRTAIGASLLPPMSAQFEQGVNAARAALGDEAFAAAWARGQAMTLEQAIEAALAPDTPAPAAAGEPGETAIRHKTSLLTARERKVAELIARGHSNRQIAAELVISERTVHAHVRNILDKLEFESRAQVAAWTVQEGLRET
jgi:predicted ATPase/DNA-binding NarL/FixJ family response regulator